MAEENLWEISTHEFFFETWLYKSVSVSSFEHNPLYWSVDGFNWSTWSDTTYAIQINHGQKIDMSDGIFYTSNWMYTHDLSTGIFITVTLTCKRHGDVIKVYLIASKDTIQKVWQYPSLADIQSVSLRDKYNNILDNDLFRNFKTAIWLNAHGVWAGSFVYLRRIFEKLIQNTFDEHKDKIGISDEKFKTSRMEDKIEELRDYLPEELVKMKGIYSILSYWVHELSEEDCQQYFPALKLSIELILDNLLAAKAKALRAQKVQAELSKITSTIKS